MIDVKDKYREEAYALACADAAVYGIQPGEIVLMMSCKILRNRKYIMAVPSAGIMYEITYNGDKGEWYVDRYRKESNAKHLEKPDGLFAKAVSEGLSQPQAALSE